jgi:hypothetical protein
MFFSIYRRDEGQPNRVVSGDTIGYVTKSSIVVDIITTLDYDFAVDTSQLRTIRQRVELIESQQDQLSIVIPESGHYATRSRLLVYHFS